MWSHYQCLGWGKALGEEDFKEFGCDICLVFTRRVMELGW